MKTFCKNQENLCTFETKFLNRQKKKEKVKRNSDARRRGCCRVCRLVLALWLSEI